MPNCSPDRINLDSDCYAEFETLFKMRDEILGGIHPHLKLKKNMPPLLHSMTETEGGLRKLITNQVPEVGFGNSRIV